MPDRDLTAPAEGGYERGSPDSGRRRHGQAHPARIYDYMLQGNSYFQADRLAAEQILKAAPEIRDAAWSNRGFHQRAAKWIAQQGVRQFVDIGSGFRRWGTRTKWS